MCDGQNLSQRVQLQSLLSACILRLPRQEDWFAFCSLVSNCLKKSECLIFLCCCSLILKCFSQLISRRETRGWQMTQSHLSCNFINHAWAALKSFSEERSLARDGFAWAFHPEAKAPWPVVWEAQAQAGGRRPGPSPLSEWLCDNAIKSIDVESKWKDQYRGRNKWSRKCKQWKEILIGSQI